MPLVPRSLTAFSLALLAAILRPLRSSRPSPTAPPPTAPASR